MKPYYIMSPRFRHNSGGVRAVHVLRDLLVAHGCKVTLSYDETLRGSDAIVVLPDIYDNAGQYGRAVRWLLYYPKVRMQNDELVFYYDKMYDVTGRGSRLFVNTIELDLFYDAGKPRTEKCFYIGKGNHKPRTMDTTGMKEITAGWPATRAAVADLLQRSSQLVTYDEHTALVPEALLCGCQVIIVHQQKPLWIETSKTGNEYRQLFVKRIDDCKQDVSDFITRTQKEFSNA